MMKRDAEKSPIEKILGLEKDLEIIQNLGYMDEELARLMSAIEKTKKSREYTILKIFDENNINAITDEQIKIIWEKKSETERGLAEIKNNLRYARALSIPQSRSPYPTTPSAQQGRSANVGTPYAGKTARQVLMDVHVKNKGQYGQQVPLIKDEEIVNVNKELDELVKQVAAIKEKAQAQAEERKRQEAEEKKKAQEAAIERAREKAAEDKLKREAEEKAKMSEEMPRKTTSTRLISSSMSRRFQNLRESRDSGKKQASSADLSTTNLRESGKKQASTSNLLSATVEAPKTEQKSDDRKLTVKQWGDLLTARDIVELSKLTEDGLLKNREKDKQVLKLADQWSKLNSYVLSDVLKDSDIKRASLAIQQWVDIAHHLAIETELKNYNASWSIFTAINGSEIRSVIDRASKLGIPILSADSENKIKKLDELFSPASGYQAYRDALNDNADAIPYFGLASKDMIYIKEDTKNDTTHKDSEIEIFIKKTVDGISNIDNKIEERKKLAEARKLKNLLKINDRKNELNEQKEKILNDHVGQFKDKEKKLKMIEEELEKLKNSEATIKLREPATLVVALSINQHTFPPVSPTVPKNDKGEDMVDDENYIKRLEEYKKSEDEYNANYDVLFANLNRMTPKIPLKTPPDEKEMVKQSILNDLRREDGVIKQISRRFQNIVSDRKEGNEEKKEEKKEAKDGLREKWATIEIEKQQRQRSEDKAKAEAESEVKKKAREEANQNQVATESIAENQNQPVIDKKAETTVQNETKQQSTDRVEPSVQRVPMENIAIREDQKSSEPIQVLNTQTIERKQAEAWAWAKISENQEPLARILEIVGIEDKLNDRSKITPILVEKFPAALNEYIDNNKQFSSELKSIDPGKYNLNNAYSFDAYISDILLIGQVIAPRQQTLDSLDSIDQESKRAIKVDSNQLSSKQSLTMEQRSTAEQKITTVREPSIEQKSQAKTGEKIFHDLKNNEELNRQLQDLKSFMYGYPTYQVIASHMEVNSHEKSYDHLSKKLPSFLAKRVAIKRLANLSGRSHDEKADLALQIGKLFEGIVKGKLDNSEDATRQLKEHLERLQQLKAAKTQDKPLPNNDDEKKEVTTFKTTHSSG